MKKYYSLFLYAEKPFFSHLKMKMISFVSFLYLTFH